MKKQIILLATIFLMLTTIFAEPQKLKEKTLTIKTKTGIEKTLTAEMALTAKEQAKGYMERKIIPDGTGMLFVFQVPQYLSFWMKNTPHPLSIAYITEQGRIADIFDMNPHDLTPIESTVPCLYALEVPKGWFKKQGISIGDYLKLDF